MPGHAFGPRTHARTATGPVRKAPNNLSAIWVPHSTAIYFLCSYFQGQSFWVSIHLGSNCALKKILGQIPAWRALAARCPLGPPGRRALLSTFSVFDLKPNARGCGLGRGRSMPSKKTKPTPVCRTPEPAARAGPGARDENNIFESRRVGG